MIEDSIANQVVRETLKPHTSMMRFTDRSMVDLRTAIINARRFELDSDMSSFMADLSAVPFDVDSIRRPELINSIRISAKLPFPKIWVEFDQDAFRTRLHEVNVTVRYGTDIIDNEVTEMLPNRMAWLIEEDDKDPNLICVTEFVVINNVPMGLGYSWVYRTDEKVLPDTFPYNLYGGAVGTGIVDYNSKTVGLKYNTTTQLEEMLQTVTFEHETDPTKSFESKLPTLAVTTAGGTLRFAMCLLATLADIPMVRTETRVSKGYVARGRYRKYLNHTMLKINLPNRANTKTLAKRLIAITRRKAHQVRGHWRMYVKHKGMICNGTHIWSDTDDTKHSHCMNCAAQRVWIDKHERGDASLGYVTHEYVLTHERK